MDNFSTKIKSNIIKFFNEFNEEIEKLNINRKITLIGVSKGFSVNYILSAIENNILNFGENKIQEAVPKIQNIAKASASNAILKSNNNKINWHFIGHLQSNKIKEAIKYFDTIHSIDKLSTIEELYKKLSNINKKIEIMIQVNTTNEANKFGCDIPSVTELCEKCLIYPYNENIILKGLMTIGKFGASEKELTKSFSTLREIKENISNKLNYPIEYLSMGMSNDWKIALKEGSTHLRIGRAIFGDRY